MPCSCGHLTCLCGIPCLCSAEKCNCKECAKGIGQTCILCGETSFLEQLTLRKSNSVCTCFIRPITNTVLSPLAQPFVPRSPPLNLIPGSELQATSTEPQADYRSEPDLEPSCTEETHVPNSYPDVADQTHVPLNESEEINAQNTACRNPDVADQTHAPLNESEEINAQNPTCRNPDVADQTHAPLNEFEEALTHAPNMPGVESSEDLPQNEPLAGNSEQIEESSDSSSGYELNDRLALEMKLQEMTSIWKKLTVSWLKQNPCPYLSDNLDMLVLTRKNV